MENNKESTMQENQEKEKDKDKPHDSAGFYLEGHVKIFDPATKEVFVEKRA